MKKIQPGKLKLQEHGIPNMTIDRGLEFRGLHARGIAAKFLAGHGRQGVLLALLENLP